MKGLLEIINTNFVSMATENECLIKRKTAFFVNGTTILILSISG